MCEIKETEFEESISDPLRRGQGKCLPAFYIPVHLACRCCELGITVSFRMVNTCHIPHPGCTCGVHQRHIVLEMSLGSACVRNSFPVVSFESEATREHYWENFFMDGLLQILRSPDSVCEDWDWVSY